MKPQVDKYEIKLNEKIGKVQEYLRKYKAHEDKLCEKLKKYKLEKAKNRATVVDVRSCMFRNILMDRENWTCEGLSENRNKSSKQLSSCMYRGCYAKNLDFERAVNELVTGIYKFSTVCDTMEFILCDMCFEQNDEDFREARDECLSEWQKEPPTDLTTVKLDLCTMNSAGYECKCYCGCPLEKPTESEDEAGSNNGKETGNDNQDIVAVW